MYLNDAARSARKTGNDAQVNIYLLLPFYRGSCEKTRRNKEKLEKMLIFNEGCRTVCRQPREVVAASGEEAKKECLSRHSLVYINVQKRIGRKMAGTRFMTLILVSPSILKASATISREPTQVISAMTVSLRRGCRNEASREMDP